MIELWIIVSLIACHYIGDFILQTDSMAVNKSTSNFWLTKHVFTYIIPFLIFYALIIPNPNMFLLVIVMNLLLHWITDYTTSRIASYFHKQEKRGLFFKTIGFDQLIHYICIFSIHVILLT